jgi:DNA-binding NarL/FixJ family response regulator
MTIKIIVADAHPFFIDGVCENLAESSQCQVIGRTTNYEELVQLTKDLQPDILLMDINLYQFFDVDKLLFIQELINKIDVIILSAIDEPGQVMEIVETGINGFVSKDENLEKLIEAIVTVHNGKSWFSPRIMKIIAGSIKQKSSLSQPELDEREIIILTLLSQGFENKYIARKLHLAERTIRYHVGKIMEKLEVKIRTEAVAKALQLGLIQTDKK